MMATIPLTITVELFYSSAWQDISAYAYNRDPMEITGGVPNEGVRADPCTLTFTLNNRDGRFSPRNPRSPLYGLIGRNTPIRVSVDAGTGAGSSVRFVGEVVAWPTRWDMSGRDVYVLVQAAGISQRLGVPGSPLESALRRATVQESTTAAYWPMAEVAEGSTMARSAVEGVADLRLGSSGSAVTGALQWSADDTLAGSGRLPSLESEWVTLTFSAACQVVTPTAGGTGLGVGFWSRTYPLATHVSNEMFSEVRLRLMLANGEATGVPEWWLRFIQAIPGSILAVEPDDGDASIRTGTVDSAGSFIGNVDSGVQTWLDAWRFAFVHFGQSGTGIAVTIYLDGVQVATGTIASTSMDDVAGVLLFAFTDNAGAGGAGTLSLGHPFVLSGSLATMATAAVELYDAGLGHPEEAAGQRIERLCDEQGVTFANVGDLDVTELLDIQPMGEFLDVLEDAAKSDLGLLYETRSALGLTYRTRASLYNQTPGLVLGYATDPVAGPLEPTQDDQQTLNSLTLKREHGASLHRSVDTGPLSTLAPPDGVGAYEREDTASLASDLQLPDQVGWRLHLGTWDEDRYPNIPLNLVAMVAAGADALIDDATGLELGDVIKITDLPEWMPAESIRQQVRGYRETIDLTTWRIDLHTVPDRPWTVGVWADTTEEPDPDEPKRYSPTDSRTDVSFVTGTDTTLDVEDQTGGTDLWSTAADLPVDIRVRGIRLRVTAIGAATGAVQTLTVDQTPVNGVSGVTIPAGTPVELWTPAMYAL